MCIRDSKNTAPGLFRTGVAKKDLTQSLVITTGPVGSGSCPAVIDNRCLIFRSDKSGVILAGSLPGKKEITLSSTLIFFSSTAKPTAVDVKLLLKEYNVCFRSGRYGFHQPSAITFPWRRIIMLCISCFVVEIASRNSIIPLEETPSASGVLRGSLVVWELTLVF